MVFGTREKRTALGKFTSEQCTKCKKNSEYVFFRITKFVVVFFVNLIPIGTTYECECIQCDDKLAIDKSAGKKLAKQKFGDENSNTSFIIYLRLFIAVVVIAAAIVLPLILVQPPVSPQVLKDLVSEDGQYSIENKDSDLIGIVTIADGKKLLEYYDDVSTYKSQGEVYTLHKKYEEVVTPEGSSMAPIADDFSTLVDKNLIKVQRYFYDIAKDTYGYKIGVQDLSKIIRSANKTIYPITVFNSEEDIAEYKLIVFITDTREIDVRFEVFEGGIEELRDIRVIERANGKNIKETFYSLESDSSEIAFVGAVNSNSSEQNFFDFVMNNALKVIYIERYTHYKNTEVISAIETTVFDAEGNTSVSAVSYTVVEKNGYYILQEVKDPS